MTTLNERVAAAQKALTAKKDALVAITKQLEETPDDDTLLDQLDGATDEVEKATRQYETLKKAETALAERIKEQAPAIITSQGKPEDAKELWLKKAVCQFLAHCNKQNVNEVMEERYKTNKALQAIMTKSTVPLATTFTAGWAAELVRTDVQGFIDLMTPTSVTAALSGLTMQLEFGGFDTITIPRRNARAAGTTLGGAFVGEGGAIPLGRISIGAQVLSRVKHAVISTFSAELAERSTPSIEAVIRQAILDDMSMSLDAIFLGSGAAVAGVRPAGITNGVVPVAGTPGGGIDAVIADIKAGIAALTAAGLGTKLVLLVNTNDALSVGLMQTALGEFLFRDELSNGTLLGITVIRSLNIPVDTAILLDASAIATAFDPTAFNVSDVASVIEANADAVAPTHADNGSGALGTAGEVPRNGGIAISGDTGAAGAGAIGRSLWQTNSVGIRAIQPVGWGVIIPGAVYVMNALTW